MNRKDKKTSESKSDIVKRIPRACADEVAAVEFLESQRWGDKVICPHCGCEGNAKMLLNRKTGERNKRFLWWCPDCNKQFTVRVGTVFEDSRIPLRHWCYAFWAACASKKGVSAKQIQRQCQISYKSALFMMHRIRFAMSGPDGEKKLQGIIEADETYVGGKYRPGSGQEYSPRDYNKKAPVFAAVERDGEVRAKVIADVTGKTLRACLEEYADFSASRLMTDEWPAYRKIGRDFAGGHGTTNHRRKEYAKGDIHSNTAESFFALLKRGINGTFHAVSKKHLHRYVSEFGFR